MPSPHPLDEEDTHLARRLHAAGRVPLEQLSPLLNRARSQRAQDPEASLGRLLVNSGLISGDELEHLLHQDPALDERTLVAERPGAAPEAPPHWHPGARVAGYVLEAELGRGGMGVVMRARHLGTGRLVALKGLLYDDLDGIERFTREVTAQAAADDHPNVVRVYEAGQAGRQCYLAMELLTGGDLAGRLKRDSALAPREAAAVVAQLARGLAHVHAQGILHRDLKPQNVLFDGHGTPKLVDFGLARLQGVEGLTQTGQILGTPSYMAPEQALARDDVDARADVYGLGAILFACLTGRPPFQGQLADVLTRVVSEAPPQPSSLVPDLAPELEAICLRALSKRPGARYPDAASFAEALEAWGQDADRGSRAAPRGGRALALLASCAA
ncbi:MAG: serine/threonine protein kinase, partial [Planctomycetes bacterium]|nr:serine/threonine protein kinase [Planctomycetota bacterium]